MEYSGYRRPTQYSPRQQPNLSYARRICCAKQDQTLTGREPAAFSSSFRLLLPGVPEPSQPRHSCTPGLSHAVLKQGRVCCTPGSEKAPSSLFVCGRLSSYLLPKNQRVLSVLRCIQLVNFSARDQVQCIDEVGHDGAVRCPPAPLTAVAKSVQCASAPVCPFTLSPCLEIPSLRSCVCGLVGALFLRECGSACAHKQKEALRLRRRLAEFSAAISRSHLRNFARYVVGLSRVGRPWVVMAYK